MPREYTYIGGDAYSAPVAAMTRGGSTKYYYLLRDYLGSITQVVNSDTISKYNEYSFDAWGRRPNANDRNYTLDANDLALGTCCRQSINYSCLLHGIL